MAFLPAQGGSVFKRSGNLFGALERSGIGQAIADAMAKQQTQKFDDRKQTDVEKRTDILGRTADIAGRAEDRATKESDTRQGIASAGFAKTILGPDGQPVDPGALRDEEGNFVIPEGSSFDSAGEQAIRERMEAFGLDREAAIAGLVAENQRGGDLEQSKIDLNKANTERAQAEADFRKAVTENPQDFADPAVPPKASAIINKRGSLQVEISGLSSIDDAAVVFPPGVSIDVESLSKGVGTQPDISISTAEVRSSFGNISEFIQEAARNRDPNASAIDAASIRGAVTAQYADKLVALKKAELETNTKTVIRKTAGGKEFQGFRQEPDETNVEYKARIFATGEKEIRDQAAAILENAKVTTKSKDGLPSEQQSLMSLLTNNIAQIRVREDQDIALEEELAALAQSSGFFGPETPAGTLGIGVGGLRGAKEAGGQQQPAPAPGEAPKSSLGGVQQQFTEQEIILQQSRVDAIRAGIEAGLTIEDIEALLDED